MNAAGLQALQVADARFRQLFDYVQVGVVLADENSYYLDANPAACDMLGYSRDELIGLHASDIVVPAEVEHVGPALEDIHRREDHRRQWRFRRKDGCVFAADVVATRMPDGTLLGIIRDLTDRSRVHEYREHMAAIVESSADAIIGIDLDGHVTSWNAGATAMYGYAGEDMIGSSLDALVPSNRRDEQKNILERLRRGERVDRLETIRLASDGRELDVSVTVSPIKDADGTVVGASGIARDYTALRERERELGRVSRMYAALSRINQAIGRRSGRDTLFHDVCHALVEEGRFMAAWVCWQDPETKLLVPVARSGDAAGVTSSAADEFGSVSGRNLTTWSFPVHFAGASAGTLNVRARGGRQLHVQEIDLLREAAADMSRALDGIARDDARELAEHSLRSEQRFSSVMIDSTPGIFYLYDADGRFIRWNRNFETVSGYSGSEISRMHPGDFFREEDRPQLERKIAEVFEQGESSLESLFLAKDGTTRPYFFTGRRVMLEGEPCLVGMGVDISDRREAETRLAESERKYRELVENANSIILRWDAEGRVSFLNEFGQKFFGYSADEIVGRHVVGTIVPLSESNGRDLERLMGEICEMPARFEQNVNENVRRDGERVWIAWTNRIVRDAEGRVVELLSVGTDITERRKAERKLRENEAHLREAQRIAGLGSFEFDPDRRSLRWSDQIDRVLGPFPADGPVDFEDYMDLVHAHDKAGVRAAFDAAAAGRQRLDLEHGLRLPDGTEKFVHVVADRSDGHGSESRVLAGIVHDITDRVRAQKESEMRARAEAADRIKSAFLATMSHELRTPLNSILGFTGIVLQGLAGPLNEEQDKQLSMVRSSARHLLALINDVLDISKIEAGQVDVAHEPFDVAGSLSKVLDIVRPQAESKGLTLQLEMPSDPGTLVGDERRFEQVVLNLLSNAIKFTDRGGVTVGARVTGPAVDDAEGLPALSVSVADTGVGIRAEDLPTLFQPFRQLDSGLARQHGGTGLGLAISRRLVELMDGELEVTSEWGKGSVFSLRLPMTPRSAAIAASHEAQGVEPA